MITDGNVDNKKGRARNGPAFALLKINIDLL